MRIIIAGLFTSGDEKVFFETGEDIIIRHTNIYSEDSRHATFNYFPLAYFAILPGLFVYFALPFKNEVLQRILQKSPMIILELALAHYYRKEKTIGSIKISSYELFILFNPILIYASCVKGQFDIVPVFLIVLAWNSYKKNGHTLAGIYSGAAVLFKQYSIIFVIYILIILLKTDFKKFKKYFLGTLLIGFPTLFFAALLDFQGLIDHSILYHLNRKPNGHSITTATYLLFRYMGAFFQNESFGNTMSSIALIFFTILLLVIQITLGMRLWNKQTSNIEFLQILLIGYSAFFLFHKTFFFHYLTILVLLWMELKREQNQVIANEQLAWNLIYLPIVGIFKIYWMVPLDIKEIIGTNWFYLVYFTCLISHFLILFIVLKKQYGIFQNKYFRYSYISFLILLPFHFIIMYSLTY